MKNQYLDFILNFKFERKAQNLDNGTMKQNNLKLELKV